MPPRSDTSDTSTLLTEDLLDKDSEMEDDHKYRTEDHFVYLQASDDYMIKMKYAILALHSPVLKAKYDGAGAAEDSIILVEGRSMIWRILVSIFEDDAAVMKNTTMYQIAEAIIVAEKHKMKMVEDALMVIAM